MIASQIADSPMAINLLGVTSGLAIAKSKAEWIYRMDLQK